MKCSAILTTASALVLAAAAPVNQYTLQQHLPAARHSHHHELRLQARDNEHPPTIPPHTLPTHHDHNLQGRGMEKKPTEPKPISFVDGLNGNPVIIHGERPVIRPLNIHKNKTCKCIADKDHKKLEPGQTASVKNAASLVARSIDEQPMSECEKKVYKTRKMLKGFMHFFRIIVPWHTGKPTEEYHGSDDCDTGASL